MGEKPSQDTSRPRPSPPAEPELRLCEGAEVFAHWHEVLDGRAATELSEEELRGLLRLGVPLKHRHTLWRRWAATTLDREGLVDECAAQAAVEELQARASEVVVEEVGKDVPRTAPKSWLSDAQCASLQRVLQAYGARNVDVGYCQGMNFLAMVFLLLGFGEGFAYVGLCHMMDQLCPGYHGRSLEGYVRDVAVLGVLVHHKLPALHQQLEASGVQLIALGVDHFLTLGSRTWPFGQLLRLWDVLLLEGQPALFASFLALLDLHLPSALIEATGQAGDALDAADVMASFKAAVHRGLLEDVDRLLQRTREFLAEIPQSLIDDLRRKITSDEENNDD